MTIKQYQEEVELWIRRYGIRYFDEKTNALLLVEEVGELVRIIAREYGEQSYKNGKKPLNIKRDIADEMIDILFVLTCLANQMGINLTEAITLNMNKKSARDKTRHSNNEKLL
jgi:NTP pyrophosphatase (non-canonical NTP hydrolase)